ncbi:MAG: site-specific integrase [Thiohalospira sp.]
MATFQRRQTRSGKTRWFARVRVKGYPATSKSFDTKREAKEWAAETESKMLSGQWRDTSLSESTTVVEVLQRFRECIIPQHKSATSEASHCRQLESEPAFAKLHLINLDKKRVALWRDQRLEQVGPATVVRELGLLQQAIEYARDEWGLHLPENPVRGVRRPRLPSGRERRLSPDEERYLLEAMTRAPQAGRHGGQGGAVHRPRNVWLKPAFVLALETAMRRSELVSLRWEDVDLSQRVATLWSTKNGDKRTVALSGKAVETLQGLPRSISGQVIQMTSSALQQAWERARKRARKNYEQHCHSEGIPPREDFLMDLHWHDLRHEATSRLFEKELNLMEVASITGHKDPKMLRRYTHMDSARLAEKLA